VTLASQTTPTAPTAFPAGAGYQSGVCNIGPAEVARRRRAGHVGLGAAIVLLAGLVAIDAPPLSRLLVAFPAAVSASGYLQARLRFCAGFGSRGVYNFGELGETQQVDDAEARGRDRERATQIGLASAAIGVAVALVAVGLPAMTVDEQVGTGAGAVAQRLDDVAAALRTHHIHASARPRARTDDQSRQQQRNLS